MAGYIGSKASVVSSGAERKKIFTITGATTSLTGFNYTVGKVHVFQNGVRLVDGTDYTATNGTTITLTVAAQSGDNVVAISQAGFQVADALSTSGGTMTGDLTVQGTVAATAVTGDGSGLTGVGSTPSIDDNGNATAITIDSSENVGIGTSSPSYKLDVASHIQIRAGESLRLQNVAGNSAATIECAGAGTNSDLRFRTANTERLRIDTSGRVTKPSQPSFLARPSSTQSNIPNLTTTLVAFGNETFDRGNNFSSSIYTAPVTGVYQFNFGLRLQSVDTAANYYQATLNTSNSYFEYIFSPEFTSDVPYLTVQVSALADMDAGDTAKVEVLQAFGDGAMDIHFASHFSGYLVA